MQYSIDSKQRRQLPGPSHEYLTIHEYLTKLESVSSFGSRDLPHPLPRLRAESTAG